MYLSHMQINESIAIFLMNIESRTTIIDIYTMVTCIKSYSHSVSVIATLLET
jgi:hypothetical protein